MEMTKQFALSKLWIPAAFLAALGISGCAQNDLAVAPPAPQPLSMALKICDTGEQACAGSTSFSVGTIRDLSLDVDWQNVPGGTHTQEIALVQPNGVVYQTVSHSFAIPDGTQGSSSLNDVIPVAGTFITLRSLTGDWSVEISLDGHLIRSEKVQFGL